MFAVAQERTDGRRGSGGSPTLWAQRQLSRPLSFTWLREGEEAIGRSGLARGEAAFVLLVAITTMEEGDTFVFDLREGSVSGRAGTCDFVRFELPATALNELAQDGDLPRVFGMRTSAVPFRDPVMNGLALSPLPDLQAPEAAKSPENDLTLEVTPLEVRHDSLSPARSPSRHPDAR